MLYNIADHLIRITGESNSFDSSWIKSFEPFTIKDDNQEAILYLNITDDIKSHAKEDLRVIRDVDTGNGKILVLRVNKQEEVGDYQFMIRDIEGKLCAMILADSKFCHCDCKLFGTYRMKYYGLNSAIMLAYAFATAPLDTMLIHASVVKKGEYAYAFTAKSGTGKSTQVSNWLWNIPGCELLNDDNPVIRVINGQAFIYGSPWSGKTPCYRNAKARLGGVAQIVRDTTNRLEQISVIDAFITMLGCCSTMKWDKEIYRANSDMIGRLLPLVKLWNLHCLPDAESALVACEGMEAKN